MPKTEDKMGALWRKRSGAGEEFMSGEVIIDGRKHAIVVFGNGFKEKDNQPDLIIYRSQKAAPRE